MKFTLYHADWTARGNYDFDSIEREPGEMTFAEREGRPDLFKMSKEYPVTFVAMMGYKPAAKVECEGIDQVFYYTNTVNHYWWEHENVEILGEPEKVGRSSCIGDLIHDEENSKWYVIDRYELRQI